MPLAGGRLAGLFQLLDVLAPEMQVRADAVARDLIERFADPAVDATLGPGDPGLFTDAGSALFLPTSLALQAGFPSTRWSIPPPASRIGGCATGWAPPSPARSETRPC